MDLQSLSALASLGLDDMVGLKIITGAGSVGGGTWIDVSINTVMSAITHSFIKSSEAQNSTKLSNAADEFGGI